jgi:two-component system sensor histidine kinase YesM
MQAELKDQKEIAESITLLGKMMRYCLRWRTHRVLLSQEIEYIYDYIRLMNIRNDYVISLSVHIDQVYLNKEIPKMLIQPVVENAVLHALEPMGDNGVIDISAIPDEQSGVLWIIVSDSGAGMDSAQIDSLGKALATGRESESSSGGIGLINIQQRLHAFYGKEYTLGLESSPGQGTIVRIPVPLEVS